MVFVFISTIVNLFIQARFVSSGALASAVVAVGGALIVRDIRRLHATFNLPRSEVVGAGFSRRELSAIVRRYAAKAERVSTPAEGGSAAGARRAAPESGGAGDAAVDAPAASPRRSRPRHLQSTLFFRASNDRPMAAPTAGRAGQL
jgi:hypothetical protein